MYGNIIIYTNQETLIMNFVPANTIATASQELNSEIAQEKEIQDPSTEDARTIIASAVSRRSCACRSVDNDVPCKEV